MIKINCIECWKRLIDYLLEVQLKDDSCKSILISKKVLEKNKGKACCVVEKSDITILNWVMQENGITSTIIAKPCYSHKGFYEIILVTSKDTNFIGAKELDEEYCTVIKMNCECKSA